MKQTDNDKARPAAFFPMALDRSAAARFSAADPQAATTGEIRITESGVAIIPIMGFLSARQFETPYGVFGGRTRRIRERVTSAAADGNVKAIVLHVDSPGGSTDGITEAAAAIRAAGEVKPVIAVADTVAASAAYWLAAQATDFVATPSADLGSIGVYMHHESYAEMDARIGVQHTFIAAGRYKTEGNPFEALTPAAAEYLQTQVDSVYAAFIADVAAGRRRSEAVVRGAAFGEGRMMIASEARAAGLIDRIATMEEVLNEVVNGSHRDRRNRRAAPFTDPNESAALELAANDDLAKSHRIRFFH